MVTTIKVVPLIQGHKVAPYHSHQLLPGSTDSESCLLYSAGARGRISVQKAKYTPNVDLLGHFLGFFVHISV